MTFESLGAVGDGVTNDRAAFVAASGKKVRGRPGATYYIGMDSYEDSIQLLDNTHWVFDPSSTMEWDYFGAPLFHAKKGSSDNIVIDDAHIVWNNTVSTDPPGVNAGTVLRPYFDSVLGSENSYIANWFLSGADHVTLNRPRCSSKVPGANKSIYINIRLSPTNAAEKGGTVIITDPVMDDYVMGLHGNGFERLDVRGTMTGGRFDEYNRSSAANNSIVEGEEDLNGWAPGHLIYLSGDYFDNASGFGSVYIGDVIDQGEYQGGQLGGLGTQAIKFRFVQNLFVKSCTSFRPGGIFDSTRIWDAHIGPLVYKDTSLLTDDFYTGTAIVRIATGDAAHVSENVTFESIDLDITNTDQRWLNFAANPARFDNIVVKQMTVTADLDTNEGGMRFWDCDNSEVQDLRLFLSGALDVDRIAGDGTNTNCAITGTSRGATVYTQTETDDGVVISITEFA